MVQGHKGSMARHQQARTRHKHFPWSMASVSNTQLLGSTYLQSSKESGQKSDNSVTSHFDSQKRGVGEGLRKTVYFLTNLK